MGDATGPRVERLESRRLLSTAMELAQYYIPERVSAADDVYANLAGTMLGAIAANLAGRNFRDLPFREILWLREVMEMSYAEIAEVQDVPIGTVMSRLHAARRKAAAVLRKDGW